MKQLRQAAARERRLPVYWWLGLMVLTGGCLVAVVYRHWPHLAGLVAILLGGAWLAPVLAYYSLAMPRRPETTLPAGRGSFAEWKHQVQLLGRLLLYYGDVPHLPLDMQQRLRDARNDLRDVLRAHPLRDDLERVADRVVQNAVIPMKIWQWAEFGPSIADLVHRYEAESAALADEDERALALQTWVQRSAAEMARNCMPRMLEYERLECMFACSTLAILAAQAHGNAIHPIELAAMFAVNWCDFTEPWLPALLPGRVINYHREHPDPWKPAPAASPAAPAAAEAILSAPASAGAPDLAGKWVIRNGKRYRRVRVRRKRRHARRNGGPSLGHILLSFGQWVRYSIRAWISFR